MIQEDARAASRPRRWIGKVLAAWFVLGLANLFAIAVTQGTLQIVPIVGDRFLSFELNAALCWLALATWELRRRRYSTDGALNRYRLLRLVIVGLCLFGVTIFFRHGIRLGADGPNYFIQARSLLFDHDIDFTNDMERVRGVVPDMPERSMGLPLLAMPFLLLAHGLVTLASLFGRDLGANGFGYPYETAFGLASYVVGSLGVIAMFKTAHRVFSGATAFLSVVTVVMGSFLAWYLVMEPAMPHAVSSASVAFLVCFWTHRRPLTSRGDWLAVGALVGLATLARWQNVVFGLLPLLDAFSTRRKGILRTGSWSALSFAVVMMPQLLYWYSLGGSPFELFLERHQVDWAQLSVAQVLFSTNRGLFPWSPVLYLAVLGLFFWLPRSPRLAGLCLLGFLMEVYINGSAEMWWGGWAYGGRRFDNSLVVFVLGFAALLEALRRRPLVPLAGICVVLVAWNLGIMVQTMRGDLASDGTVSFRAAAADNLDLYYRRVGFPAVWPVNWWFSARFGVSPEKFDRLFGHIGFGNLRLLMDESAEPFLGTGWSASERDLHGAAFRWALGRRATVLVPLKDPHRYSLSIWATPHDAAAPQTVGLRVNDVARGSRRLEGAQVLVWEVEPGVLRRGVNQLTFEFARSARASSTDARQVAARFHRLELIARDVTP